MHQQQEPLLAQPGEVLLGGPVAAGCDRSIEVRLCCRAGVGVCGHGVRRRAACVCISCVDGLTVFQGHAHPTPWLPDMRG